jgi:biopolymer transport protein ExbD
MKVEREKASAEATVNMTPLLDMMFILIIFFLATSRFQAEERDEAVRLVKSSSNLPIAPVTELVVINIDRDGQKIVDGRIRSLEEVESLLRERLSERPETEVVVRADTRGVVQHLAQTLETCHRLGIKTPKVSYEAAPE